MKSYSFQRVALFLLGVLLVFMPVMSFAVQDKDDPESLIQGFRSAWKRENYGMAHHYLRKVVASAPDRLYLIAGPADSLLNASATFSGDVADTLLLVYESAISHAGTSQFDWMVRRAVLLVNHRQRFGPRVESALYAPFQEDPMACPEFIIENLWDEWMWQFRGKKRDRENLALAWAEIDQVLEVRMATFPRPPIGLSDLRSRVRYEARKSVGMTCEGLDNAYLIPAMDNQLSPQQWQALFALVLLVDCQSFSLENKLLEKVSGKEAGLAQQRWALNSFFFAEDNLELREKLVREEENPLVRGVDMLALARLQARGEEFSQARETLQEAARLNPGWGMPWLELAELIVMSAPICSFSEFDRKAIYWAAMEFCQKARDLDPNCEQEGSERVFEYSRSTPGREEILFKGLQPGDSYPIRCWIEMAVRVR
ncbi:MAG: hypothetical protein H6581_20400 [Bacteroidia bacterium]|nr:hypothetical protein [Bacteroidia bacterium]